MFFNRIFNILWYSQFLFNVLELLVFQRIEGLLPRKKGDTEAIAKDNRLFVEAELRIVRTGNTWRDLSEKYKVA